MKRVIIEESSVVDWDFSAVFVDDNGCRNYVYFNNPHEIIEDIEKLKAQSNKHIESISESSAKSKGSL